MLRILGALIGIVMVSCGIPYILWGLKIVDASTALFPIVGIFLSLSGGALFIKCFKG